MYTGKIRAKGSAVLPRRAALTQERRPASTNAPTPRKGCPVCAKHAPAVTAPRVPTQSHLHNATHTARGAHARANDAVGLQAAARHRPRGQTRRVPRARRGGKRQAPGPLQPARRAAGPPEEARRVARRRRHAALVRPHAERSGFRRADAPRHQRPVPRRREESPFDLAARNGLRDSRAERAFLRTPRRNRGARRPPVDASANRPRSRPRDERRFR